MSIQLQILKEITSCTLLLKVSIQLLLDNGANTEVTNYKKSTPLHVAAEEGCIQVLEILLEHSASVHVTDQDGNTPLLKTCKCNKKILDYRSKQKIVELLLMYGALIELYHTESPKLLSRPNKKQRKDCEMWGAICATPNINLHRYVPSLI